MGPSACRAQAIVVSAQKTKGDVVPRKIRGDRLVLALVSVLRTLILELGQCRPGDFGRDKDGNLRVAYQKRTNAFSP
jgi:hypothetical protein